MALRVWNINPVPKAIADETTATVPPTANTLYTILAEKKNVRLISITSYVTWTVQPDPLDIVVTIDGNTWQGSQANPVSTTPYGAYLVWNWANAIGLTATTTSASMSPFLLEGRLVKVEARTGRTTAGTVSRMDSVVKYAKWD